MKLRTIILILSLLAILSTITGGRLYYLAVKRAAIQKIETNGDWHAASLGALIDRLIVSNLKTVQGISVLKALTMVLAAPDPVNLAEAHRVLDGFHAALDASVVYLLDRHGDTIASSNRHDPDSFMGKNYAFRPYFAEAIAGNASVHLAMGITSGRRGVYYSYPVYSSDKKLPAGVVVVKGSVDALEKELFATNTNAAPAASMVTSPKGLIFMADHDVYRYRLLEKLSEAEVADLVASKQFDHRPLVWSGLSPDGDGRMIDLSGDRFIVARKPINSLAGWQVVYLQNVNQEMAGVNETLSRNLGVIILVLCLFIGVSVATLYGMARADMARRKRIERALADSEEKFRSMSASVNDGLLTIDDSGAITFWNDTAEVIFGYSQAEVLGKELHPLLAPPRYLDAYQTAFAKFRQSGAGDAIGKTLEMTALRKDGSEFPIELSLAAYHSNERWHAVGTVRDISARKQDEAEKETLINDLQTALKEVRQLSGLLPICAHCKKIRDDKGYWNQIEAYIQRHSDAEFSHSVCEECAAKYYPDIDIYED